MSDTEVTREDEQLDVQDEDEEEINAMKKRVQEMEAEAQKLREMQANLDQTNNELKENKEDIDARSIFVGNVDYGASPEDIQTHFQTCGSINRVTILLDKFSGHPKGYAYVEFSEPSLVANALVLNESQFRGRSLKVVPKRTNLPGMARGRGRGGMGGPRGRGGMHGPPRGHHFQPYGYGAPPPPPYGYGPPRGGLVYNNFPTSTVAVGSAMQPYDHAQAAAQAQAQAQSQAQMHQYYLQAQHQGQNAHHPGQNAQNRGQNTQRAGRNGKNRYRGGYRGRARGYAPY